MMWWPGTRTDQHKYQREAEAKAQKHFNDMNNDLRKAFEMSEERDLKILQIEAALDAEGARWEGVRTEMQRAFQKQMDDLQSAFRDRGMYAGRGRLIVTFEAEQ